MLDEECPGKTVKKDYELHDDLKKGAKCSHRVAAGAEVLINKTKDKWSNRDILAGKIGIFIRKYYSSIPLQYSVVKVYK